MKRYLLAALAAAVLAGCGPTATPPAPTITDQGPAVVTVDPAAVATAPNDPALYPDAGGALTSDAGEPNGAMPDVPPDVADQATVSLTGLGGVLKYATMGRPGARLTPAEAVAVAIREAEHPSGINWQNRCEGFAGSFVYGWGSSGWYSARDAAHGLPNRHKFTTWSDAPAGALIYWDTPPFGHAVLSLGGNGKVASTDILTVGRVSVVPLKLIADRWFGGTMPYGWFDPVSFPRGVGSNGIKAPVIAQPPTPKPAALPVVSLHKLRAAAWHQNTYCKAAIVRRALGGHGNNCHYSKALRARYRAFQRAHHLTIRNGRPNRHSLTLLARKSGSFTVTR